VSDLATEDPTVIAVPVAAPGRVRAHLSTPMFRNAYALLLNTGITSLLGLAYWALAAHRYPAVDIGRASSAISALQLLSGVAQCNLNNVLPRLVPTAGTGTARLVARSYGVAVGLSLLLAAGFAVLAARYGWAGGFLAQGSGYAVWFVLAVAFWSVFYLEDAVFAGLRKAVWVPVENTSFSLGKMVLLVALAGVTLRFGVFGSFTIPVAIAVIPVNWLIFRRLIPRHAAQPVAEGVVGDLPMRRYLVGEYTGGLANLATTTMLPLLVASEVGSVANAYFYSAWIVGSSFEYVLSSIAVSLVVEGANDRARASWAARRGAAIAAAVLLPAITLTLVAAPTVLRFVGSQYAASGTVVLRLVALAVLPRAVISLTVATARIRKDVRTMTTVQVAGAVLTIGSAAWLLPSMGLTGAGIAYAGAQGIVALCCLPGLLRTLRGPRTGGPVGGAADDGGGSGSGGGGSGGEPSGSHPGRDSRAAVDTDGDSSGEGDTGEGDSGDGIGGRDLVVTGGPGAAGGGTRHPVHTRSAGCSPGWRTDPATVAAALAAGAIAVLVGSGVRVPGQPVLAAAFLLWVPGAAVVGYLRLDDRVLAAALSIAASIAIGTLGAEVMLWTGTWHPRAGVLLLAVACIVALALQARGRPPSARHTRGRRNRPSGASNQDSADHELADNDFADNIFADADFADADVADTDVADTADTHTVDTYGEHADGAGVAG
jgi:O-antigen/teichoic acid export membrane protein